MKTIKIFKKKIGDGSSCFISFEVGATWMDFVDAKKLIKAASISGANAIKFQTFLPGEADRMINKKTLELDFKTVKGKKKENMLKILKRRELPKKKWKELVDYSHKQGLAFITTANFLETIDFLKDINVDAIKISKGDINNVLLIDYASKKNIPIILDGREKFSDVEKALKICEKNKNFQVLIMHCPSGYPAESAGVHLKAIGRIKERYEYPVGYADHSPNDIMNYGAITLGANMLEKTITSNKKTDRIEHLMSLEINELKEFVRNINELENAMGNPNILQVSRVNEDARRSIIAKETIAPGEKISLEKIDFQRPGNLGISASEGFKILNKKSNCLIKKGTIIKKNMLK